MNLLTENYEAQRARWPSFGRHVLAHFDQDSIVVYQAYRRSIGEAAARDGRFGGGGFSFDRMSWIKPNFLWMMYRSGWGTKSGQEVVLAVRLRRAGFDEILENAVHSSFVPTLYESKAAWQQALRASVVRLQWDPDHAPNGAKVERRAIQLGLRGKFLERYAKEWTVEIEDVSEFVAQQRARIPSPDLEIPREDIYPIADSDTVRNLGTGN